MNFKKNLFLFFIFCLNLKTEIIITEENDSEKNNFSEIEDIFENIDNYDEDLLKDYYFENEIEDDFYKNKNHQKLEKNEKEKKENTGLSEVLNVVPDSKNLNTYLSLSGDKDIKIELDGKFRVEGQGGINTRYLNNNNGGLDTTLVLGKSTVDFGIAVSCGEKKFNRPAIEAALNLRNRSTWGKPDVVGKTTSVRIQNADYLLPAHSHDVGIPILYVRGFDLTLDLNALLLIDNKPLHHIKFGLFPFELGRGISLGAAYAVTPDFITYDPGNMIQEFAPGFKLYGSFDEAKNYSYKTYLGILKNLSGSFNDINESIRNNEYGMSKNPQRGFGVMNLVGAFQFDCVLNKTEKGKIRTSPYVMVYHEGEGNFQSISDSTTELTTIGFESVSNFENFEFGFEFAKNFGIQNIKGIDKNSILYEQRTVSIGSNINSSIPVETNSAVTYVGITNTTDIKDSAAVYLGSSNPRQVAINSVNKSVEQNGKIINYDSAGGSDYTYLKNSADRFRDPYQNSLEGWMTVADISYKFKNFIGEKDLDVSIAAGFASGDDNPNSSLLNKNDYIKDTTYGGFVGVQEIYSGTKVKSVFLMSGAGSVPRVTSIPALDSSLPDSDAPVDYPSRVSRFNNIMFLGTGINFSFNKSIYKLKLNPNFIYYRQAKAAVIYNENIIKKLGLNEIPSSLGIEANLFFELTSGNIDGLKFFGTFTGFFPGDYYSTLKNIPLDKKQQSYLNDIKNGKSPSFIPTLGNNNSYYANIGIELAY